MIGPAPVLALLVGSFHTALYVLIRGSAGGRLPLLLAAAFVAIVAILGPSRPTSAGS